ncbi:serine/threonine-protein kinase [Litorihabitans aurantiacus]|uniref:non-specific serine/threonine protein kinase n=1 Tax=Litorihabitans aurantiacus TaxID=1930061 RepID=A0AA38CW91_9MICO|nr:serine/threonine-protein kinase [Litorihabitans aurantiacus]GMA32817.1 hypothetical protein GCM10025875_28090 [Litorihabitans aurantiacus]
MPPEIPGVDVGAIIGRGGNAVVHAGVQRAVQRPVAVKIDTRAVTDERDRRRFAREATAAGRISSHPHVVSLIDAGTTADHHPYLVMELCEGGSLADVIRREGPLPVVDALDIGIAVTGALAAAHEAGILHRDVKPGNVLIDAFGTPRLSDFGLAARAVVDDETFSATLEALTPAYAPPEAFEAGIPTARSDVWSMGATIYAMLVGGAPRRRPDGGSLSLSELVAALPARLPLPEAEGAAAVMEVLWRATAYDAARRHPSAADLREDLRRVRNRLGPATGHVGGPEVTVVMGPPTLAPAATGSVATAGGMARAGAGAATRTGVDPAAEPGGGSGGGPTAGSDSRGAAPAGSPPDAAGRSWPRRRRWLPVALTVAALVVGGAAGSVATRAGITTATESGSGANDEPVPGTAGTGGAEDTEGRDGAGSDDATGTGGGDGTDGGVSGTDPGGTGATPSGSGNETGSAAPALPEDECWGGIVSISGNVTASPTSCAQPHAWESYAVGSLDEGAASARSDDVAADPQVLATCTPDALETYLGRAVDPASVRLEVIPPSEAAFLAGERGFACVVAPTDGGDLTASMRG